MKIAITLNRCNPRNILKKSDEVFILSQKYLQKHFWYYHPSLIFLNIFFNEQLYFNSVISI